ncbi:hypothetical protein XENOCAPTIV_024876 [Xenoophorus captivus]|uniref:Uncharacterized protein n=1 Tax=Xenoophorus captivus TaxID=1517983 RepID=A0ABV0Q630_9TELE
MVALTTQGFNWTGSTQNLPHYGRPKKLSAHAQLRSNGYLLKIDAEVEGVGGQPVSVQNIRRTLHQIGLHDGHSKRKMMHKKATNSLMKTSRLRSWFSGTMSCGPMRPR